MSKPGVKIPLTSIKTFILSLSTEPSSGQGQGTPAKGAGGCALVRPGVRQQRFLVVQFAALLCLIANTHVSYNNILRPIIPRAGISFKTLKYTI